ncbi:hypothetical protein SDRG_05987 [Saprolegnia diclina VS20]|uniref:PDZ domain-containing protein n=1 Tax=Saprolegnia diclina (strain VS20) TaxID=1156394 RepID=T0RVR6_SAPDV|nr:hypothetical protein SDRG_05987 [Saprolegnia diclina VS20]EQC36538.1 hypothetical protein SDRG_05987 [Saprolegnia diclina VS20]|eukprot:XP_008609959.1 hypothetical protein SDRG_05987 [Saprolegnia diclina VS20]
MAASSWRLICRRTASQSFGLSTKGGGAQRSVIVSVVLPQSPAYLAGLAIGDEILAAEGAWHECNMALPPRPAMDSAEIVRLLENENARCISLYVRTRSMSNALAWHLERRLALVTHNRRGIPANAEERDAWLYAMTDAWDAERRIQEVRRSSPSLPLASPTDRKRTKIERSGTSAVARHHGADQAHVQPSSSTSLRTRRVVSNQSKRAATASPSDGDAPPENEAVVEWPTQLKRRHPPNCEIHNRVVVAARRICKGDELYV